MQILVVEDEVRLAQHISRALIEAGHEPAIVHDGETAVGEAQEKQYDLVVLDVMLPGMDGFEVLRRLRAAKMDIRVLILTARGEVSDRHRSRLQDRAARVSRCRGTIDRTAHGTPT